ncbi:hypothetical protein VB735_08200 [Halotia wernerae UHCC 0503]|nr:hypothetical protein [Halotia wernerae UHCC 0503]
MTNNKATHAIPIPLQHHQHVRQHRYFLPRQQLLRFSNRATP